MEIYEGLVSVENSCVGLGFFDGVHLGHKALLKDLVNLARSSGLTSVILTFKESPAKMFCDSLKYISSTQERENMFRSLGVDVVVELDFNEDLMNLSADEYLNEIVFKNFKPKYIFSGFNHTFGKNKSGDAGFLKNNQAKYSYIYKEIPPVMYESEVVSSSVIKKYISAGDIKRANAMLGYEFSINGVVIEGNKLGKSIGFPTANICYPNYKVEIPYGVYKASAVVNDKKYNAILNYGNKPTVSLNNVNPVAEVHIIGFNSDIYGQKIDVNIRSMIRSEKRFDSLEGLKQQIIKDIELC